MSECSWMMRRDWRSYLWLRLKWTGIFDGGLLIDYFEWMEKNDAVRIDIALIVTS